MPYPSSFPPPTEVRTAPGQSGVDGGPERHLVLVVEDDEDSRFLLMESLVQLGYAAAGAPDAERGIEAAIRLQPQAILMDLMMPGLNGIDATRRIKADARTHGCLVIVMTGRGVEAAADARAAGCDAFLPKPFGVTALEHTLQTLLASAEQPKPPAPVASLKRCGCGREFTLEQWLALPLCGRDDSPPREVRNCTCGSSLELKLQHLEDGLRRTAAKTAPPGMLPAERETVFVVDSDPHIRRLIQQFVGDTYAIEFLDDGSSALDRVRASPPLALITEILIPRLDGLALCRLLKGDPATLHMPILVISMLAADTRVRQSGANAFLSKPLERSRLVASLRGMTQQGRPDGAIPPHAEHAS